jgi:glycosyltransferase involved in cell wall biosynthesis
MNPIANFAPAARRRDFSIACVVPVYNEGGHIGAFLRALHTYLKRVSNYVEIIVVNDGSHDNSAEQILAVADECGVHYIELARNFGKEFALQAGLDAVRSDCAVIIDGDFQHPFELISDMVTHWRAGAHMVYGVRSDRDDESALKRFATALVYKVLAIGSAFDIPPNAGDFRLLDRKVIDVLRALPERTRFMKGLYAWAGFKSVAVPFVVNERGGGESKFNVLKLTTLALTGITTFSTAPLRFVSLLGLLMSGFAAAMGCWIVFEKLFMQQPIAGFTTIAASILLLSGVQLLSLGIVGEYVGRIFDEVKRRPLYVVGRDVDRGMLAATEAQTASNRQHA